jgi:hypothetical protein
MLSLPDASALKMETAFFPEILVNCYYNAQCHSLEDSAPHAIALITKISIPPLVTAISICSYVGDSISKLQIQVAT